MSSQFYVIISTLRLVVLRWVLNTGLQLLWHKFFKEQGCHLLLQGDIKSVKDRQMGIQTDYRKMICMYPLAYKGDKKVHLQYVKSKICLRCLKLLYTDSAEIK